MIMGMNEVWRICIVASLRIAELVEGFFTNSVYFSTN